MKILLSLAALAAGFFVAPSAHAQNASRIVATDDLRLDTAKGVARLDRRLHLAAREVCGYPIAYDHSQRSLIMECIAETVAAAIPQRTTLLASARRSGVIELSAR